MVIEWEIYLDIVCKSGFLCGVVIEVMVKGVFEGWGVLIYGKLDFDLVGVMMIINVVKGVEIGSGFVVVILIGEENVDEMVKNGNMVEFISNNVGGILGGIFIG